ncbi:phage NrS-1 polymerase family protein [Alicyclobacillus shizuokensis]|uniref:phage NrS-1 polymerase family protein n=1 Tax=Alicyclobacillus shizuokensis TaxID=392014 RepID=UPI0008318468|nr:DUF927 domain-containing protein [Alicyclobacillus shizuokensis]
MNNVSIYEPKIKGEYREKMMFESIPNELKERKQWVLWKYELVPGEDKPRKVLYDARTRKKASVDDPNTWTAYGNAATELKLKSKEYDGIGYVFSDDDPYTGVDLDHCTQNGKLTDDAMAIVERLNSYTELSPSGEGVHIFVRAQLPGTRHRRGNIEMYDSKRFFTVTGKHMEGTPTTIEERQEEINAVYREFLDSGEKKESASVEPKSPPMDDDTILRLAYGAKNGFKFADLFEGRWEEYYKSQSEADQALCNMFAFFSQDPEQIDRLFRRSGLYREHKWERDDYRERTIQKAIADLKSWYGQRDRFEELPEGMVIPKPFFFENGSLFKLVKRKKEDVKIRVCTCPVWITGRYRHVRGDTYMLSVQWRGGGVTAPQSVFFDSSKLIKLADMGLPVGSETARALSSYLVAFEAANRDAIPTLTYSDKFGDTGAGFLIGEECIGGDIEFRSEDDGAKRMTEALRASGTDRTAEILTKLAPFGTAKLVIYAALAAPMLHMIGADSFAVDIAGETRQGKTTVLKLAASLYGHPDRMLMSWNTTRVAFERYAGLMNHLPMFYDETNAAPKKDLLPEFIYQFSTNMGKGRGSLQGTRKADTWRTVLLTTGEEPIVSLSKAGGATARVLVLQNPPFGERSEATAETLEWIKSAIEESHGHAARAWIAYLADVGAEVIAKEVSQAKAEYRKQAKGQGAVAERLAEHMAVLDVAGRMCDECFNVRIYDFAHMYGEWLDILSGLKEYDRPQQALDTTIGWVTANSDCFAVGTHVPLGHETLGRIDENQIAIIGYIWEQMISNAGFSPEGILKSWRNRGWLIIGNDGANKKLTSIRGKKSRCVCIDMKAAGVEFNADETEDEVLGN